MAKKKQEWADTVEEIAAARLMDVTLLSGAKVTLQTVTLDELALEDGIPGDLIEVAILDSADLLLPTMLEHVRAQRPDEVQRLSRNAIVLADRIALRAIVRPDPTEALIEALDGFDKKMILEIAQRKRGTDATGKAVTAQVLADLEPFRPVGVGVEGGGDGGGDEAVAGDVG